jgi:hypothetical protein
LILNRFINKDILLRTLIHIFIITLNNKVSNNILYNYKIKLINLMINYFVYFNSVIFGYKIIISFIKTQFLKSIANIYKTTENNHFFIL